MPHVVIVGGGLTGLSVAFRLRQLAPAVTVTRAGTARPARRERRHRGARRLPRRTRAERLPRPHALACRTWSATSAFRTGSSPRARAAARTASSSSTASSASSPRGPLGLLTSPLLSLRGKWQLLTEPWRKTPVAHAPGSPSIDESIAAFVTRRAGKEAADIFADALVTGIHGGDPALLSVAATFPRLPHDGTRSRQHHPRLHRRAAKQRRARRAGTRRAAARPDADVVVPRGAAAYSPIRSPSRSARPCGAASRARSVSPRASPRGRLYGDRRRMRGRGRRGRAGVPRLRTGRDRRRTSTPNWPTSIAGDPVQPHRGGGARLSPGRLPASHRTASATSPRRTRAATCSACSGVRRSSRTAPRRAACCGGRCAAVSTAPRWSIGTMTALAQAVHAEIKLAMGVSGEPVFARDRPLAGGDSAVRDRPPRPRRPHRRCWPRSTPVSS